VAAQLPDLALQQVYTLNPRQCCCQPCLLLLLLLLCVPQQWCCLAL
jgi:hypothetical protein